jgi:poly(A) polymerase
MTTSRRFDYTPYRNRWIAVVNDRVVGVGDDADQAYRTAKGVRPKDRPQLLFVDQTGQAHLQPENLRQWFENELLRQITLLLQHHPDKVYLVGGAVRDGLLGKLDIVADLDLVVPREALSLARTLADQLKAAYYPVDPEREVGRIVLPDQTHIDIAIYRGATLFEDLSLRDFTINAIALKLDMDAPKIIDPLFGQADLRQKIIRATSEAALQADPLRAIRAVRLAAQFDFTITPETQAWVSKQASNLKGVSVERLRDEVLKLLQVDQPGSAVAQLNSLGLLSHIIPEVIAMVDVAQSPPHHLPVFEHTLAVMDWTRLITWDNARLAFLHPIKADLQVYFQTELPGNISRAALMPLAALLHDIGKPQTFTQGSDGRIRFWNHPQKGADIATQVMTRWHFSVQATRFVTTIVRHHMRPLLLAHEHIVSKRAIHRFLLVTADAAPAIAILSLFDHLGMFASDEGQTEWQRLTEVVLNLCQAYFSPKPPPLLTGQEVMNHLQLTSGPLVGHILRELKEAQAIGQITTKEEALAFARELVSKAKSDD